MIPNTLQVIESSIANETYLALHHVNEVSKVILPSRHISSDRYYGHVTCFVTNEQYFDAARDFFYNQDMVGFSFSYSNFNNSCTFLVNTTINLFWTTFSHSKPPKQVNLWFSYLLRETVA